MKNTVECHSWPNGNWDLSDLVLPPTQAHSFSVLNLKKAVHITQARETLITQAGQTLVVRSHLGRTHTGKLNLKS